jgi:LysM repeat protein
VSERAVGAGPSAGIGQLIGGLAVTLVSVGMLLGSFLLSQLDGSLGVPPVPTGSPQPSLTLFLPTITPSLSPTLSPSPSPSATEPSATETATPPTSTPSPFPIPSPAPLIPICPRPWNWFAYTVQYGDTLNSLAWRASTTVPVLMQANCLSTSSIYPGQSIYLPPTFYTTPTPWPPCGPPRGWVKYIVQPGDTLYSLSRRVGVNMETIRHANCLPSYTIYVGKPLFLPALPPAITPIPTLLPTAIPTLPPTLTDTPIPSLTPTDTPVPTLTYPPTPTKTAGPTLTPTLEHTSTPGTPSVPTETPTPTPGPTGPPASTDTPTPLPTEPPASTPTPTTAPAEPTATHTPVPTTPSGGE